MITTCFYDIIDSKREYGMYEMKKKSLILILMWTIVIIPLIPALINCSDWYKNGANVAWEGEKWEYGLQAVCTMLQWGIAFYYPVFIIWVIFLIVAIIIAILARIKKNNNMNDNR